MTTRDGLSERRRLVHCRITGALDNGEAFDRSLSAETVRIKQHSASVTAMPPSDTVSRPHEPLAG